MPSFITDFPYRLVIGHTSIPLHGIMECIGVFVAFRYYLYLRRRQGDTIAGQNRISIIIGATFGAVLGARIIGSLEDIPTWTATANKWLYFFNNKTLVGGLLGGLAGVETAKRIIREKQNSGDLFVFPLLLGMILGRIGCCSAGIYEETYGLPSSLPWAMNLGDGIPRHPVTLYEILFLAMLWIALAQLKKRVVLEQGALFKLFLMAYLVFRFLLDFIKPGWRYVAGLGTIQLACLCGLLYYYRYLLQPKLLLYNPEKNITHAR